MIMLRSVEYHDCAAFADSSYEKLNPAQMQEMITQSLSKNHNGRFFELLLVWKETTCVGFVSLYGVNEKSVSCGPEIKPQYRKRGIAFAATEQALEYAKGFGYTKAVAEVRKDNAASIALHGKLGFFLTEEYTNAKGNLAVRFEKML